MKTQNTNFIKGGHTVPQNDRWNLRNKKVNYNFFLRGHLHGVIGQNVRKSTLSPEGARATSYYHQLQRDLRLNPFVANISPAGAFC